MTTIHVVYIEALVDRAMDRWWPGWEANPATNPSIDTWVLGMIFGNDDLALQEDLDDDPAMARAMGYLGDGTREA